MQDKDRDVDIKGSSSKDNLNTPECIRNEDYYPTPNQGHSSRDGSDNRQHCYKHRKATSSPYRLVHSSPTSAQDSRHRKQSTRAVAHSLRERNKSALGLLNQALSHTSSVPSDANTFLAQFQE